MSNQTDHTIVRLRVPPELKQKIEESAEKNNRSQSAEMVSRLEQSYDNEITPKNLSLHQIGRYFELSQNIDKLNTDEYVLIDKGYLKQLLVMQMGIKSLTEISSSLDKYHSNMQEFDLDD